MFSKSVFCSLRALNEKKKEFGNISVRPEARFLKVAGIISSFYLIGCHFLRRTPLICYLKRERSNKKETKKFSNEWVDIFQKKKKKR